MPTPTPSPRSIPDTSAAPKPVRTRYDLPARPLTLGDARLAVANATLAACLEGRMVLVRPRDAPCSLDEQNRELLQWLGIEWLEASLDETWVAAQSGRAHDALGSEFTEPQHLLRLVQDRSLGITHAVISIHEEEVIAISQHATETRGWHVTRYVPLGATGTPNDGTPTALRWYRERGYLPEALRTHLAASACWATPPTKPHIARMRTLYRSGQLSRTLWYPTFKHLQSAGHHAMREADLRRVTRLLRPRLGRAYGQWHYASGTAHTPKAWLAILASALQQESACLEEAVALARFAFVDRVGTMTPEASAAVCGSPVRAVLAGCLQRLQPQDLATPDRAKLFFQELRHHYRDTIGLRGRQVMFPIRAALTRTMAGPCLGVVASLLGYERCRRRLHETLESLPSKARNQS